MGSIRVRVTLKYEQFLCKFLFFLPRKQHKRTPESFDVNNDVIIMTHT